MKWLDKLRGGVTEQLERPVEENPLDKVIVEKGSHPEVNKVYEARWVWYHTILAVEIFFTNILLVGILLVLAFKG
jgi:hypothetical protein